MAGKFLIKSRHGTIYYFRRRVPLAAQHAIGRRVFVQSLEPSGRLKGVVRGRALAAQTDSIFQRIATATNSNDPDGFTFNYEFRLDLNEFGFAWPIFTGSFDRKGNYMKLAETIHVETGEPLEAIQLLRHSNEKWKMRQEFGVTVYEYTALQPIGSIYDYSRAGWPRIRIVVAIVNDLVHAVYRVLNGETKCTNYSGSVAFRKAEEMDGTAEVDCFLFQLEEIPSVCTGLPIQGWTAPIIAPLRHGGDMYNSITVGPPDGEGFREAVEKSFQEQVAKAFTDSAVERSKHLEHANKRPVKVPVTTFVFTRNPYVVAEVLARSEGVCGACGKVAPFPRRSDKSPYLEVHHRIPLATGGDDTVENAIALCPNCHRKAHYG